MINVIEKVLIGIIGYLKADWYILLIGILIAVSIKVYVDPIKFKRFLEKNSKLSIPGSVAFGSFTPLCACGTMAVLLSMFITSMPWGAVMAFLISSPLTSPSEFMFQASFLGIDFAIAVLITSIILGVAAGFFAHFLEKHTGFFDSQFRLQNKEESCCKATEAEVAVTSSCCSINQKQETTFSEKYKIKEFIEEFINIGIKKVLFLFIIFIALGQFIEIILPQEWILSLFGSTNSYSIPLGATIGLPLYVSGPSALPLMEAFLNAGAGKGAILAFLVAGKATGIPVITGMSTILKKRAMLFYIGVIYIGSIFSGFLYQLLIAVIS